MPYYSLRTDSSVSTQLAVSGYITNGNGPYGYNTGLALQPSIRTQRSGTNSPNFFSKPASKSANRRILVGHKVVYYTMKNGPRVLEWRYVNGKLRYFSRRVKLMKIVPIYKRVRIKNPPNTLTPNTLWFYKESLTFPFGNKIDSRGTWGSWWQQWSGSSSLGPFTIGASASTLDGRTAASWLRTTQAVGVPTLESASYTSTQSDCSTVCLSKLKSKIRGDSFNLGNFLVEIEGTVGLIATIAYRLSKAILALKKGQIQKAWQQLIPSNQKALASDWLLFQFGILPLLSDLDSACKSLASKLERPAVYDYVAKTSRPIPSLVSTAYSAGLNNLPYRDWTTTYSGSMEVKYKARVRVIRPNVRKLADLGLTNPAAVAWEAIPFSFMIDYLINIGGWLQGLTDFQGLQVEFVSRTTTLKSNKMTTWRIHQTDKTGNWSYTNPGMRGYNVEYFQVYRENLPTSVLTARDSFPSFNTSTTFKRLLNTLAILTLLKR